MRYLKALILALAVAASPCTANAGGSGPYRDTVTIGPGGGTFTGAVTFNAGFTSGFRELPTDGGVMGNVNDVQVTSALAAGVEVSYCLGAIDSNCVIRVRGESDGAGGAQNLSTTIGSQSSFSGLWYHGVDDTTTISAADALVKVTSFENTSSEDPNGNAVGDPTTDDDITIAAGNGGVYQISMQVSLTNSGGASREFKFMPCVDLATALTITGATNATPIVVTSTAHGLKNGDVITISGVGGNTAANGDHTASNVAANTFEVETMNHVDVAGNGAYTSGGAVDRICPGNIVIPRAVSAADLGRGAASGKYELSDADTVSGYVTNLDNTDNAVVSQINLDVTRVD